MGQALCCHKHTIFPGDKAGQKHSQLSENGPKFSLLSPTSSLSIRGKVTLDEHQEALVPWSDFLLFPLRCTTGILLGWGSGSCLHLISGPRVLESPYSGQGGGPPLPEWSIPKTNLYFASVNYHLWHDFQVLSCEAMLSADEEERNGNKQITWIH